MSVHALQLSAKACFEFTNAGTEPVEILSVRPSCGCLVPKMGKTVYEPGESGSIEVDFLLRGRTGKQKKHVMVTTSANRDAPYRLTVSADIPEAYTVSAKRLMWERAAEYEPLTCKLINKAEQPIELGEILPTMPRIKAELKCVKPGFEYDLVVTPDPGVENIRAYIQVKTVPPEGMDQSKDFKVYVFVK